MNVSKCFCVATIATLSILAFLNTSVDACSCMPSHPQTHYCDADYVIIMRVLRKSHRLVRNRIAYKVEIKKSYKMNANGHHILKHGRIQTPDSDSMCGVTLDVGKLYVVAGRAPILNLCSYIKEYLKMSLIERRGFAGAYKKGCSCKITPCFGNQCLTNKESATGCKWGPFARCETSYSFCTSNEYDTPEGPTSKCHWRRSPAYKACMVDP